MPTRIIPRQPTERMHAMSFRKLQRFSRSIELHKVSGLLFNKKSWKSHF